MNGDRTALVLDEHAGLEGQDVLELVDHVPQAGMVLGLAPMEAVADSVLQTVKTPDVESVGLEMMVQEIDRTAADDRQGSPESPLQPVQDGGKFGIDRYGIGSFHDIDQRSVEIEEERPSRLLPGGEGLLGHGCIHRRPSAPVRLRSDNPKMYMMLTGLGKPRKRF